MLRRVRAAELAAGRDEARADRAVRAAHAAMQALEALKAALAASGRRIGTYATTATLRRALRRAAAHLVAPGPPRAQLHDGDDWRAGTARFAGSHPPRPRLYDTLADDEAKLPHRLAGQLPFWSPAAAYGLHLLTCGTCRQAEATRAPADCQIHVVVTMLEGLRPVPGGQAPRPPTRPAGEPRRPRPSAHSPEEAAILKADWSRQLSLGTARLLSPHEREDPMTCAEVAGMHIAYKHTRTLPPHLAAMGTTAPIDAAELARHAAQVGRDEARAYRTAAGTSSPADPAGRDRLRKAHEDAIRPSRGSKKPRPVVHLNRTANTWSRKVGNAFPEPADFFGGLPPGSWAGVMDAQAAYMGLRNGDPACQVAQCPATGDLYAPTGGVFGSNSCGAAFCVASGLLKEAIRGATPLVGGVDEVAAPDEDVMACATPGSALHGFLDGLLKARPQSLLAAQRGRRLQATGTSDDIGMAAPDRQTAQDLVTWAHAIAPLVGYTRAPDKDQFGQILTYNGLQVNLTGAPLASARAHKIHATYADFAYLAEVGAGGFLPFDWYRSFIGSVEWLGELDAGVRLRRFLIRSPLTAAERLAHSFVTVSKRAADTAATLLRRAMLGQARAARTLPVDLIASFSLDVRPTEAGMQAEVRAHNHSGGRQLSAISSDASLERGVVTCGILLGSGEAAYIRRPATPRESSTSAELSALADTCQDIFAATPNTLAVWVSDSKGATDLINSQDLRPGTASFRLLERIHLAAESYGVELFAVWVPRTLNTLNDALSNCRSHQEAAGWASRHGRQLRAPTQEATGTTDRAGDTRS